MQGEKQGEEENRVKKTGIAAAVFYPTFGALPMSISTFYIPFQSSGSQESNASNGARFGVETKKLWPFEADHSKSTRYMPQAGTLRTSRWKPILQPCEFSLVLKIFRSPLEWLRNLAEPLNLNAFNSPGPTLGKASDLQPWKCTSLPLRAFGRWFEEDLVFEPINGKHLYNTGAPAGHESAETPIGHESNGAVAGDFCACHIEYEIAEEAMNFMSYMAEVSRGWDEPNARDMGRMTTKFAAMERRLEKLEMTNMQPVQAISQTPLQAMPCAICLSYEHLGMSVLPFQPRGKCLVIATPTIPIGGTIQISLGNHSHLSISNLLKHHSKPQSLNKL
ncbi:hypothetical protein AAG906_005483 [Vitis piasezkii]